jgi:hypothetical protein
MGRAVEVSVNVLTRVTRDRSDRIATVGADYSALRGIKETPCVLSQKLAPLCNQSPAMTRGIDTQRNTNLTTEMNQEIATINRNAFRPIVKRGGDIQNPADHKGIRYTFGGTETPAELRARFKAQGLKGNKLSDAVRNVRNGSLSATFLETQAFLELLRKEGFAPTIAEKTARSATIKLAPIGQEKAKKSDTAEKVREEIIAKLIANTGATREQIEQTLLA